MSPLRDAAKKAAAISGLRRISLDMLDPQLLERPSDLRQPIAVDLAAGLGVKK
jgi:hypothetical protein